MVDFPNELEGERYRLNISDGTVGPSRFKFFCLATDLAMDSNWESEDITKNDCDNPTAKAKVSEVLKARKTNYTCGGVVDAKKLRQLRDANLSGALVEMQCVYDETAANGGYTEEFFAYVKQLKVTKQNQGIVRFEATLSVNGDITTTNVV